jgi:hypothetical protein
MKNLICALLIIAVCIIGACRKKNTVTVPQPISKNLLVVGNRSTNNIGTNAVQWYNGQQTILSKNGKSGYAVDCILVGTDQYVAGYYDSSSFNGSVTSYYGKPCYWKNGVEFLIATPSLTSYPVSIANSGADIFILCKEISTADLASGTSSWVLYKNGIKLYSDSKSSLHPHDLEIDGNNIYILAQAFINGKDQTLFYKNNVATYVSNPIQGVINTKDMCIINGDVNITGVVQSTNGFTYGFLYSNGITSLLNTTESRYVDFVIAKNAKPLVFGIKVENGKDIPFTWFDGVEKNETVQYLDIKNSTDGKLWGITYDDEVFIDNQLQYILGLETSTSYNQLKALDVK